MPPPLGQRALGDDARLTSVCLSRTSGISRKQRGLGLAQRWPTSHVTPTPLLRSKGQKVKGQLAGGGALAASRTACYIGGALLGSSLQLDITRREVQYIAAVISAADTLWSIYVAWDLGSCGSLNCQPVIWEQAMSKIPRYV